MPTYTGTSGDDAQAGTTGDDSFSMLAGNDTVFASSGNDQVSGGDGNDSLDGGAGDDVINGDAGDDWIWGRQGNDIVDGGAGNDTLAVRNDYYQGNDLSAGDRFIGGDGVDTLYFYGDFTYGFSGFDITAMSIPTDIENIRAELPVILTFAQLSQFAQIDGIFTLVGSGTLDLTGNRFLGGSLRLGDGNDIVTVAGNIYSAHMDGGAGDDRLIGSEAADGLNGGAGRDRLEGRGGNDSLQGGGGNDTLFGGAGDDEFFDDLGADNMDGGGGNDVFHLDTENGFSTGDRVVGGLGVDTIYLNVSPYDTTWRDLSTFNIAADVEGLIAPWARFTMTAERANQFQALELYGLRLTTTGSVTAGATFQVREVELSAYGNSVDLSAAGPYNYRVLGGGGADTITGSSSSDELTGAGGNDVIHAGAGHDAISGGEGADWLDGGDDDDTLSVAPGEAVSGDRFTGGAGNDVLRAVHDPYGPLTVTDISAATIDADIERLEGSAVTIGIAQVSGFNSIQVQELHLADAGTVSFAGQVTSGTLKLSDLAGNHVTLSDTGFYATVGGLSADTIVGGAANDQIYGEGGGDHLSGGAGNDMLVGGVGTDTLVGGPGDDIFYIGDRGDVVVEAAGGGTDTVVSTVTHVLAAGVERLDLMGEAPINGTGNALANRLVGNYANNVLNGRAGADVMIGQGGNDTYIVDNAGDIVEEAGYGGIDLVKSSVSFTLSLSVENLTLTGSAAINGTGNDQANVITGNAGANVLRGLGGNDRLQGGAGIDQMYGGTGDDTYAVDNAADLVSEASSAGTDTVNSSVSFTLGANVERLTLVGTAAINATGNSLANILTGNRAANVLDGGGGADVMKGGAGNDTYLVNNAGDVVREASSSGIDLVQSTVSYGLAVYVENLTLLGTGAINGTGNAMANILTGNAAANTLSGGDGNDTLSGLAGADTLAGGRGNDSLTGGAGVDTFLFDTALNASTNVDRITDFAVADDTIRLDQSIFAALGLGTLSAGAFRAGTAAQDADDRLIYDSATGRIYYDADGNGAGAAVLFAQVNAGIALTNADFVIGS